MSEREWLTMEHGHDSQANAGGGEGPGVSLDEDHGMEEVGAVRVEHTLAGARGGGAGSVF